VIAEDGSRLAEPVSDDEERPAIGVDGRIVHASATSFGVAIPYQGNVVAACAVAEEACSPHTAWSPVSLPLHLVIVLLMKSSSIRGCITISAKTPRKTAACVEPSR
jgi:hypothetical protein